MATQDSSGIAAPTALPNDERSSTHQSVKGPSGGGEIEVNDAPYFDSYVGKPQQLLNAGIITAENLAILDTGKRTLRLFPDGRAWLGKHCCPEECKSPGGKFIQPTTKKRLEVWVYVTPEETKRRHALLVQQARSAKDREELYRQRAELEMGIQALIEMTKERIQSAQSELDLPDDQLVAQRRLKLRDEIVNWESDKRSMIIKLQAKLQALGPGEAPLQPRLRLVYSDRRAAS